MTAVNIDPRDIRDVDHPSWILKPFWQWIVGTSVALLIAAAFLVPVGLVSKEQSERSDGITAAAVKVVCGISAFVDKQAAPLKTPSIDPVSRQAANQRAHDAVVSFRALQPQEYLSHCKLAPLPGEG